MAGTRQTNRLDKTAWKKAKKHRITLPSGFEVVIEIPNLAQLVQSGYLPNELVQEALRSVERVSRGDGNFTPETIANQAEFYKKIITKMVVEPELTEEDVVGEDAIPFEDIEMLAELATRQRDIDAMGNHIGGLHTSKQWRTFRGLEHLYEDVPGAEVSGQAMAPA